MTVVRLAVRIEPLDPLLFGDNRSARAGEDHALADQDPSPATIYGAVGARIASCLGARAGGDWGPAVPVLGDFAEELGGVDGRRRAELLGYALADPGGRAWFPRPLHFRVETVDRKPFSLPPLAPAESREAVSSLALPRHLAAADGPGEAPAEEEGEVLVDEALLGEILAGTVAAGRPLEISTRGKETLFRSELRAGLGMDNEANAAAEGLLFTRPYRRFARGLAGEAGARAAGYLAWYEVLDLAGGPAGRFSGDGFLGGDRRRVHLDFAELGEDPLARVRDAVLAQAAGSRGWLAYLLTPAVAPAAPSMDGRRPVAAAIGRPRVASGWDGRRGRPQPILHLLPPGSVLFFEWEAGLSAAERAGWIEDRWLAPLAPGYGRTGFGRVLLGVWT